MLGSTTAQLVLALGSAGCGTQRAAVGTNKILNQTLGDRRYLLFVPPSYVASQPAPVVLSYHGGGRTADDQLALDQLTNPYFNTEYIVIYPYGIDVHSSSLPLPPLSSW